MKLVKSLFLSIITLISCFTFSIGCGSDKVEIVLEKSSVELAVGESYSVQVKTFTVNGTAMDKGLIEYSSSDDSVVTVNNGVVTALKNGSATVSAKYSQTKVNLMVIVVNKTCLLEFSKDTVNLALGLKEQADLPIKTFTLDGQSADTTLLNCVSSNPAVATVSNGKVIAVGKGETIINVTYGTLSKPLTVHVHELVSATDVFALNQNAVLLQGRTYRDGSDIVFDNANSGIEINFYGTELRVCLDAPAVSVGNYSYVACFIDGEQVGLTKLDKTGEYYYPLASGLTNDVHTALILKATESFMNGVGSSRITMTAIYQNEKCTLLTPPTRENRLKIDFYGDSISSGYGNLGTINSPQFITAEQDGTMTYASITGRSLNALVSIISCSGISAKVSFYDNPDLSIYNTWDKYSIINAENYAIDPDTDYVVINLGTNDANAISQLGYTANDYKSDFLSLLTSMKGKYTGDTKFIWCYGMMGENELVKEGVELALAELGGESSGMYYLKLPQNQQGAQTHPTVEGHKAGASVLTQFINSLKN